MPKKIEGPQTVINQSLFRIGTIILTAWAIDKISQRNDTINYVLYQKGKNVYQGICLKHRLIARLAEHKRHGKIFDEYDFNPAATYSEACRIEERRIHRDQTKYNVHYR